MTFLLLGELYPPLSHLWNSISSLGSLEIEGGPLAMQSETKYYPFSQHSSSPNPTPLAPVSPDPGEHSRIIVVGLEGAQELQVPMFLIFWVHQLPWKAVKTRVPGCF